MGVLVIRISSAAAGLPRASVRPTNAGPYHSDPLSCLSLQASSSEEASQVSVQVRVLHAARHPSEADSPSLPSPALSAHQLLDRGASVLLLDKQGFMGGNSTKATSGINGAGTAAQSDLGITDSAKTFFDDTKASAKDLARDDLIKVLTGKSADAVHWLMEKFELDLSKVSRLGGHSQPRTHRGGAQFPGMVGLSSPFSV